jgi:acetolactate synthase-1/2/3 large subunit
VESIPQVIRDAWHLAMDGIPGPVHVSLPADVLLRKASVISQPLTPPPAVTHDNRALDEIAALLVAAERPLIIVRPSAARGFTGELVHRLASQLRIAPVITGPPRALADSKYLDIAPNYRKSDCALVIAPSDYALGFLNESVIAGKGKLVVIDAPGDPPLQRTPTIHTQALPQDAIEHLVRKTEGGGRCDPEWSQLWSHRPAAEITMEAAPNEVHPLEVADCIRKVLRPDDILSVDGGEFCQWMRQGLHDVRNRWLWNSKFGIIGNSIPMAFGVMAAGHRGRTIALMGDGGCAYHIAEFEAAARYGLPFTAIIGNDARWGAEWHLQAHRYGADRTFDTSLLRAQYDQVAAGYGALGFHAQTAAAFREALDAALASGKPACINVDVQSLRSPSFPP